MLRLHTYFRSSASFRVRIALNLKGLPWEPEVVWLPAGEQAAEPYCSLNPQRLVPLLVDGEHRIAQSLAIIEYLDETKPGARLLPADPLARARVRSLSMIVAADIHPLNNLRVLNYLRDTVRTDQETIADWYRHWCDEGLSALECELADGATGRFCHGDTPTMVDVCLVPQIFNARRFDTKVERYARVMRIYDECMRLQAFRDAEPSVQPEAARAA